MGGKVKKLSAPIALLITRFVTVLSHDALANSFLIRRRSYKRLLSSVHPYTIILVRLTNFWEYSQLINNILVFPQSKPNKYTKQTSKTTRQEYWGALKPKVMNLITSEW